MVQTDPVAVVLALGLSLSQPDRAAGAAEVPDGLTPLALHLADPVVAQRAEQLPVEGQAVLDRGDDEVDVMDTARAHRPRLQRRSASSCARPERAARRTGRGAR